MSGFKTSGGGFKAPGGFKAELKPLRTMPEAPDPLADCQQSEDLEADTKEQLGAIEKGFRERQRLEQQRFLAATETAFYCCLVFDSNAQCDAFLKATGLDKSQSDLFVDGRVLARQMGIELPEPVIRFDREFKTDKKLTKLAQVKGKDNV